MQLFSIQWGLTKRMQGDFLLGKIIIGSGIVVSNQKRGDLDEILRGNSSLIGQ